MKCTIEQIIAQDLKITRNQVWTALRLLDSGATVPFIARYRKEATGGLTDTHLRMLAERLQDLRKLEARRAEIIESIQSQGKLNDSLLKALESAQSELQLEDLYMPYRPRKRTRAEEAREAGLEQLAEKMLKNPDLNPEGAAKEYINPLKNILNAPAALAGARDILIERFSEDATLIGRLRKKFWEEGWVLSKISPLAPESQASKFSDYFNFRERIKDIPSHRVMAIFRGRQENILRVSLETNILNEVNGLVRQEETEYIQIIQDYFNLRPHGRGAYVWLAESARDAWKHRIRFRLELDLLALIKKNAEEEAIRVFGENLRNILMAPPAGARVTMGIDPGFRSGVKIAVTDKTGKLLDTATIYPLPPEERIFDSEKIMASLLEKYCVELIAIGNGTGARETDRFVEHFLRNIPEKKIIKIIVSEAGASVYSASALGSKEFPDLDVSLRGAVSIARRLQDPLAELVKIEPKAIGVGQYQHDVNQRRLEEKLRGVIEDCVNTVGVNVNTASPSLLAYVSGLSARAAENVVSYRDRNGAFKTRMELLKISDIDARSFEQAAGFLRIQNGDNPLDGSGVHPESYPIVEKILAKIGKDLKSILGTKSFFSTLQPEEFVDEKTSALTVQDILAELERPGRDPRPEFKTTSFKENVTQIQDLKPGMILEGAITNVTNFGAFIDIGVHQDGLAHISELSSDFVMDAHAAVKTGQIVKVRVLAVDLPRKRISLSLKLTRK